MILLVIIYYLIRKSLKHVALPLKSSYAIFSIFLLCRNLEAITKRHGIGTVSNQRQNNIHFASYLRDSLDWTNEAMSHEHYQVDCNLFLPYTFCLDFCP